MVRGSRAVGVSWDMGMAQGLRVGVWEGSEMVYCTTAASHLKSINNGYLKMAPFDPPLKTTLCMYLLGLLT